MKTGSRTNKVINITGLSIILITVILKTARYLFPLNILRHGGNMITAVLYLLFFALWGISLRYRVIQKHTRSCFLFVACLEEFWIFIRTLKYEFIREEPAARYIWYLYYLPMISVYCAPHENNDIQQIMTNKTVMIILNDSHSGFSLQK